MNARFSDAFVVVFSTSCVHFESIQPAKIIVARGVSRNTVRKVLRSDETSLDPSTTGVNNPAQSPANMKLCWKPRCCQTIRPRSTIGSTSSRCSSYCVMTATAVAMMPYAGMTVTGNNTMVIHRCQITNVSPYKSVTEYSNLPVTVFPR